MKKYLIIIFCVSGLLLSSCGQKTLEIKPKSTSSEAPAVNLPGSEYIWLDYPLHSEHPDEFPTANAEDLFNIEQLELLGKSNVRYNSFCFFRETLYFSVYNNKTNKGELYEYNLKSKKYKLLFFSDSGLIDNLTVLSDILFFTADKSLTMASVYKFEPEIKHFTFIKNVFKEDELKLFSSGEYLAVSALQQHKGYSIQFIDSQGSNDVQPLILDEEHHVFSANISGGNYIGYADKNGKKNTVCIYDIDKEKVVSLFYYQLDSRMEGIVFQNNEFFILGSGLYYHSYNLETDTTSWIFEGELDNCGTDEMLFLDNVAILTEKDSWTVNPVERTIRAVNIALEKQAVLFEDKIIRIACSDSRERFVLIESTGYNESIYIVTAKKL